MDERANEMSQISDREQLEEPFSQQFSYPVQPNVPPTPQQQHGQALGQGQLDFIQGNTNPPQGYRQPKYPRDELNENDRNFQFGGLYQNTLYSLGDVCGNLRTACPCCFCCIVYPYVTVDQSFKGILERYGKYYKQVDAGLQYFNPCTDRIIQVDCKTQLIDLDRQQIITQDNILVNIDATVYYRVINAPKSLYAVESIHSAVKELSYATLRGIVGQYTLQNLLEKRQEISMEFQKFVDTYSWEWGVDVEKLLIKDIQLNSELQDVLSAVAKEQRQAQSKLINAQADVQSAKMMREAAALLDSKAAMQIRYLETISMLGSSGSTKIVLLPDTPDVRM